VLVTGASSGIGAATARAMSSRGARVVLVARRVDALRAVADSLTGPASVYPCDVGDPDAVAEMAAAVAASDGAPDVVVNNAGAGRWLFIEETDPREFLAQVAVPFHAAFLVTRAFIEPMLQRRSGWVVTVNSPVAYVPWPGAMGYGCSRWGVRGFTECLAADLAGTGIGVSEVVAGRVDSAYFDNNPGSSERIPVIDRVLRRLSPDTVAELICGAVEHERRRVVQPLELRSLLALSRVAPRLVARVAIASGTSRSDRSRATGP
jgi:short-subunit dehydrogenase